MFWQQTSGITSPFTVPLTVWQSRKTLTDINPIAEMRSP